MLHTRYFVTCITAAAAYSRLVATNLQLPASVRSPGCDGHHIIVQDITITSRPFVQLSNSMVYNILAMMMVGLPLHFMSRTESAPCPASTVAVHVTSAADVQDLTDALTCTGEGAFNVTWHRSLTITQTINVPNRKHVTVTGAGRPSIRGALPDGNNYGEDVDAGGGNFTGIFFVCNGSTLRLNHLVLDGGSAEYGGAVALHSSSSLFILGCAFANNNAEKGGEPPCLQYKLPGQNPIKAYQVYIATIHALEELTTGPWRVSI